MPVDDGFQSAGEDIVKFMPLVAAELDRRVLLLQRERSGDDERFHGLVLEQRRQVFIAEAAPPCDRKSAACPGDAVFLQRRAFSFQQIGGIHAEPCRAFINKGKCKVRLPGFEGPVIFQRHAGALRHFRLGDTKDLSRLPNTMRDFFDDLFHVTSSCSIWIFGLSGLSFDKQKIRPKNALRRMMIRGTTQIASKRCHSAGSDKPSALTRQHTGNDYSAEDTPTFPFPTRKG